MRSSAEVERQTSDVVVVGEEVHWLDDEKVEQGTDEEEKVEEVCLDL